jgi:dGTPase
VGVPSVDGYGEADWSRLNGEDRPDDRSPFARDYDRLVYTAEFRRLQGKTQVAAAGEADFFRTRLTHTIEVAQVARRLAESINRRADCWRTAARTPPYVDDPLTVIRLPPEQQKIDPDLVEAAAVLHDLGHPPFAHVGESALATAVDRAEGKWHLSDAGSFNGNAQSFRLAVKVMSHHGEGRGRQLTRATLDASLKYPWLPDDPGAPAGHHWSVNPTELHELANLRDALPRDVRYAQTIEAQVMDWADDVAYSVHDLEDWHRAGFMPLARLATDPAEQQRVVDHVVARWKPPNAGERDVLARRVQALLDERSGPLQQFRLASQAREPVFDPTSGAARRATRRLRANVFDDAMTSFTLVARAESHPDVPRRYLFGFEPAEDVRFKVQVLKELLWLYVVDDARMATQQHGHRRVIERLFKVYERAARHGELRLFPLDRRRHLESETDPLERLRSVADFICDLTDADALALYERLRSGGLRLHDYA